MSRKEIQERQTGNETYYLEQSLFTIGKLLGLCYGEAGAKIIGLNISTAETGGDFNPNLHGQYVNGAIYGFCNIRHFQELCIALKTDMIQCVNSIAEVVHSQVDIYNGFANKNLGSSFLFIWKLIDLQESFDGDIDQEITDADKVADLAIMGVYKSYAKINSFAHI
jgi:hypothetical protein